MTSTLPAASQCFFRIDPPPLLPALMCEHGDGLMTSAPPDHPGKNVTFAETGQAPARPTETCSSERETGQP
jgi:hypothetical protein